MSCADNNHKYGLWKINESDNMACRACKKCGFQEKFLADDTHLQEIKRQKEAELFFKAFASVDNQDEHIIGYLNVILDDYVNYLNDDSLTLLINRMEILENSNLVDIQNSMFIKKLHQCLTNSSSDDFLDVLEQFQGYNASYLASILTSEEVSTRHL